MIVLDVGVSSSSFSTGRLKARCASSHIGPGLQVFSSSFARMYRDDPKARFLASHNEYDRVNADSDHIMKLTRRKSNWSCAASIIAGLLLLSLLGNAVQLRENQALRSSPDLCRSRFSKTNPNFLAQCFPNLCH